MKDIIQSQWLVMVMTSPNRPRPTLQKCVDSIWEAGWTRFVLSEDPGYWPEISARGEFKRRAVSIEKPRGPWPHFRDMVGYAIDDTKQSFDTWDGLLILQDDAILPKDLAYWLLEHQEWRLPQHLASLWLPSFYHDDRRYSEICSPDVQPFNMEWWSLGRQDLPRRAYGALAILMRLSTAIDIRDWKGGSGMTKADYRLGEFCKDTGHTWLYPTRSLVQHLGIDNSTLGSDRRQKIYTEALNPVTDCLIQKTEVE